jgi:hypothetical protein
VKNDLTAPQVHKSVCEYVVYDPEVEREFARRLDEREDIRLCMKWYGLAGTMCGTLVLVTSIRS